MKNYLILILALPLLFFGCREDIDNTTIDTVYDPPVVIVTANLSGQIVGGNRQGEAGVVVRVGDLSTTTDDNGYYQFLGASLNARGTYVTAQKEGFFLGSDRLYPVSGSSNFSTIALLEKAVAGRFAGNIGGVIDIAGVEIIFPVEAIADAQDNSYGGVVSVFAKRISPIADDIQDIMPGGLFGLNKDSREVMMASLGMLAVELQDANGNLLQIKSGKKATLKMPVTAELLANAPSEVPLWYFDEVLGLWIEEGIATLEGNIYTGDVSHFTFWNVDVPTGVELIFVSGCIVTPEGNGVAHQGFRIIAPSNTYTYAYGSTDDMGNFSGYLPAGDLLTFEIEDNCGEVYSFGVEPLDADTNLDCFEVTSLSISIITGQVVDCDLVAVDQAIVIAEWGGASQYVLSDETGVFSMTFLNCEDIDINVHAIDIANQMETEAVAVTVDNDHNLGQFQACDNPISEYLNSNIDGDQYDLPIMNLTQGQGRYFIQGSGLDNNGDDVFTITMNDIAVGSYTGLQIGLNFGLFSSMSEWLGYVSCETPCDGITVNITFNGGPGGYLEGDFTGTIGKYDANQNYIGDVAISSVFRVKIPA